MALEAGGTAHAVWEQLESSAPTAVYYASMAEGTSTWYSSEMVSDAREADAYGASIGVDASGNVMVIWEDLRDPRRPISGLDAEQLGARRGRPTQ